MKKSERSFESKLTRVADSFLALGALAAAALFAYSISRSPAGLTFAQTLVYYATPLATAAILATSLFFSPSFKTNLMLVLASVCAAVVGTELVLAMIPPADVAKSVAEANGSPLDARDALSVARDLTNRGTPAFPHVSSSAARDLPLRLNRRDVVPLSGAIANTMTVFCNESGQWEVYQSDEHGFNNDPGSWAGLPPDVVLIGDSYTQGSCFSRDRAMIGALRETWPRLLNLGVSAAGPLSELAILREYVVDLEPEIVIWLYYEGNDLPDLAQEMSHPTLRKYLDEGFQQHLVAQQEALDAELRVVLSAMMRPVDPGLDDPDYGGLLYRDFGWHGSLVELLRLHRVQQLVIGATIPFPSSVSRLRSLPRVLEEAATSVKGWGGRFYFVYLPEYSRFSSLVGERGIERQEVLDLARQMQIPLIDLVEVFSKLDDPRSVWLHPAGHYDEDGYRMVANTIVEHILH
jgi:hypothetical protein